MLRIFISRQSRYPANTKRLKENIARILTMRGIDNAELSIALVGERKIKELAQKYLGEIKSDLAHEVLSFPFSETRGDFVSFTAESGLSQLGDVIVCYPEARKIAMKKNRMVDDVLLELAEHGTLHLLGIHHDE